MTSSSESTRPGLQPGLRPASPYTRFIPREELGDFAAWRPGSLSGEALATPAAAAATTAQQDEAQRVALAAARQSGYQDGYRDGLAALDGFKRSFSAQLTAQFGQLYHRFDEQLGLLDVEIADAVAQTAVRLARQVLRSELATEPGCVVRVAAEAVEAVLLSARRIVVRLHPLDLPLVAEGADEVLQSRGARLVADTSVERGGCLVESDLGAIDARIGVRWAQAASALGGNRPWAAEDGAPGAST